MSNAAEQDTWRVDGVAIVKAHERDMDGSRFDSQPAHVTLIKRAAGVVQMSVANEKTRRLVVTVEFDSPEQLYDLAAAALGRADELTKQKDAAERYRNSKRNGLPGNLDR